MSHLRNLLQAGSGKLHRAPATVDTNPFPSRTPLACPLPDIPVAEAWLRPESRLVLHSDPGGPGADRFRYLRTRLREHWKQGKLKKLLITSPLAGDGKSTVVANLATALSERSKHSVLVIEADLHNPSLTGILGTPNWPGLAERLAGDPGTPFAGIRRIEPLGWYLLPAGERRGTPGDVVQASGFGQVLEAVSSSFDWVLIDSPPAILRSDTISLQQHADGCLLVIKAGCTPQDVTEQTVAMLGRKKIVAVLLNGIEVERRLYDYNNGLGARK